MLHLLLLVSIVYAKFYCSSETSPRFVYTAEETEPNATICFGFDEAKGAYVIDVDAGFAAGVNMGVDENGNKKTDLYIDPEDGPVIVKLSTTTTTTDSYFNIWHETTGDLIGINTSISFEVPAVSINTGVKVYTGTTTEKMKYPITLKFLPSVAGTIAYPFFVSNSYESTHRPADQHSEWIISYEVEEETTFKFETLRTTTMGYNANDNSDFTITEMHFSKKMVFVNETRTNIIRNQYDNQRPILFMDEYEDQGTKFILYVKTDPSDYSVYIKTIDDGTVTESSSSSSSNNENNNNTTESSSSNENNSGDDDDSSSTTMAILMMLSAIFFLLI